MRRSFTLVALRRVQGNRHERRSFMLIELLLVIAVIGVLASIVITALNPSRQFAQARNRQRKSDVQSVLEAVQQYAIDSDGAHPPGMDGTWRMIGTEVTGCSVVCGAVTTAQVAVPPEADSWIFQWGANANDNYGGNAEIHVYPFAPNVNQRALIRFPLGSVPADAQVTQAQMVLTESNTRGYDRTIALHRLTRSWTENGVTWRRYDGVGNWGSFGGDFDPTPSATAFVTWNFGPLNSDTWDVTQDVRDFLSGAKQNDGWLLKDTVEDSSQDFWYFHSREAANPSNHPSLIVNYSGATEAGGMTPDTCLNLSAALVPAYLGNMPAEPAGGSGARTHYAVRHNGIGRISVRACGAELGEDIVVVR